MVRLLQILFLILLSFNFSLSNHIVGGEIEMIHVGDENSFRYEIKLVQYFDCAQTANPGPGFSVGGFKELGCNSARRGF